MSCLGDQIVVGCGKLSLNYVGVVPEFPQPGISTTTQSISKYCGGDAAITLTCLSKLLNVRTYLVSKIGKDGMGSVALSMLKQDHVGTGFLYMSDTSTTSFTYAIVDEKNHTSTEINTPGDNLLPNEMDTSVMDNADLLYLDGGHIQAALHLATIANQLQIPIMLGLDHNTPEVFNLMPLCKYVISPSDFLPQFMDTVRKDRKLFEDIRDVDIAKGAYHCLMKACIKNEWVATSFGDNGSILIERMDPGTSKDNDLPSFVSVESAVGFLLHSEQSYGKPTFPAISYALVEYSVYLDGMTQEYRYLLHFCHPHHNESPKADGTTSGDSNFFTAGLAYGLLRGFGKNKMLQFASFLSAKKESRTSQGILWCNQFDFSAFE